MLKKKKKKLSETTLTKEKFIELVNKVSSKEISSKNVKDILKDVLETELSIKEIISKSGIKNISDDETINKIIDKIIENNQESVKDYKDGKDRAIKYLMGQVMKETKGSVNPEKAMNLLKVKLQSI